MRKLAASIATLLITLPTMTASSAQISRPTRYCAAPLPAGFDWPASAEALYRISGGLRTPTQVIPGTIDVAAQRRHAWMLFAGITRPSSSEPNALPVFHTWYTVEETFDASGPLDCDRRNHALHLSLPTQALMEVPNPARDAARSAGLTPSPRFDPDPSLLRSPGSAAAALDPHGTVAFSHVAFNQEMYDFIRNNRYFSRTALDSLIDPNRARVPIIDPPTTGISLKIAWWPVASDRLTAMPVWHDDPRFPGDAKNPPTTWQTVVVVDPVGGLPAPGSVQLGGFEHSRPTVVPLSRFYSVRVSAEDAALANADFRITSAAMAVLGRPLREGDYLAMTAMHIATREFDPWVFTTFWWTDRPGVGELASDILPQVQGVFRNYVLDVSYNINRPREPDGSAPIAYSPWLELFQRGGTRSQCMACHARAAYAPGLSAAFNPRDMSTADPNGFEGSPQSPQDPVYQRGTVDLHRIWTIYTRAH